MPKGQFKHLTRAGSRERAMQILELKESGMKTREIAERFGLTQKWVQETIRMYRENADGPENIRS